MQKHRFSHAERFGIWEAHKGVCYWCCVPLEFRDVTIDHLVPESLDSNAVAEVIATYGLSPEFLVNDFQNWVPAHGSCNASKGDRLFDQSPALIKAFDDARRRGERARSIADKLERDATKARALSVIGEATSRGVISKEDVLGLFAAAAQAPPSGSVDIGLAQYPVSSSVSVYRSSFDTYAYSDSGIMVTYPGGPTFKPPATCPHCGAAGPWHGNVCSVCNWAIVAY